MKAGTGRFAARTTSRACTSMTMVSLRKVAGSNTVVSMCLPGASLSAASRREGFRESAGRSGSSRVSVRLPLGVLTVSCRRRPSTVPPISMGPVPGSMENWNDRTSKALSTCTAVCRRAAVVAPSSVIWMRPSSWMS